MSQRKFVEAEPGSRLYILPHPDDEIMAIPLLLEKNYVNHVIYLTDGAGIRPNAARATRRSTELTLALRLLNDEEISISQKPFASRILDGCCHKELSLADLKELESLIVALDPTEIVTTAYEGGHQDHDTASVVAGLLAEKTKKPIKYFATYRATRSGFLPFQTMKPELSGGVINFSRIDAVKIAFKLMSTYRSQWKTWVGVGPFVLFDFAFRTWHLDQGATDNVITSLDNCFYENRGRCQQSEVLSSLSKIKEGFMQNGGKNDRR